MAIEAPRQMDMFTGELVDNRTRRQKQADRRLTQPRQVEMFAAREVAHFGVQTRPLIPLAAGTKLGFQNEDPRTPEEQEHDLQRAAEEMTSPMFNDSMTPMDNASTLAVEPQQTGERYEL